MKRIAVSIMALLICTTVFADDEDQIQERIFKSYLEQAEKGDANAQFIVASRLELGRGVAKDVDRAYYWFEKAAKKGHPLAQRKVDERAEALAAAAPKLVVPAAIVAAPPAVHAAAPKEAVHTAAAPKEKERAARPQPTAKPKETPRPAPVAAAPVPAPAEPAKPVEAPVVAKVAAVEAPAPTINVAQAILGGKWSRNQRAAEMLPSPLATCLQSSTTEIICFSQELTRNINGQGVTYTVKGTLTGVGNRDGRVRIAYVYNVEDVNSKPFAQPSSTQADLADLAARTGWQEPGVQMDCRLGDEHTLSCTRADRKQSVQFARD